MVLSQPKDQHENLLNYINRIEKKNKKNRKQLKRARGEILSLINNTDANNIIFSYYYMVPHIVKP